MIKCEKTHGDMMQLYREQAMFSFKHAHVTVLVATMKLCGRGINVHGVSSLIFSDLADTLAEYKSCLGRVGRVVHKATTIAFYQAFSGVMDEELLLFLQKNRQTIPPGMVEAFSPYSSDDMWAHYPEAAA